MSDSTPRAPAPPASDDGIKPASSGARNETWTIGELLRWTQQRFASAGIAEPRLDAERLLSRALECTRITLYTEHDRPVDENARARFRELVRRRLAREPVAYIEGRRGFHALGLELEVDRRVLVPRPETEHLVDWMLEDLKELAQGSVLDIGTGSGAIALAIAHARPELEVIASDVSSDALAVAQANASRLGLAITTVHSDLLADVHVPAVGFAAIAANLPYIPTAELAELEPEVARHEPALALDGGDDGLQVIARLLAGLAPKHALAPNAAIYLEIGAGQAAAVLELLAAHSLRGEVRSDHAGIARVVRAKN
jgi:release factor glutamine methyltransferase